MRLDLRHRRRHCAVRQAGIKWETPLAPVHRIQARVQDCLGAVKVLGAGGGGYLLLFGKDEAAAAKIKQILTQHPPNARARFVDFNLSTTGLQLTRS